MRPVILYAEDDREDYELFIEALLEIYPVVDVIRFCGGLEIIHYLSDVSFRDYHSGL